MESISSDDYSESSVFDLVTQLCQNIVSKEGSDTLTSKEQCRYIKRARTLMYGILLGKMHLKDVDKLTVACDGMDPISCLVAERLALSCNGNWNQASELNEAIDQVQESENYINIKPILQCLVALANSAPSSHRLYSLLNPPHLVEDKDSIRSNSARPYRVLPQDAFNPPAWMSLNNSISRFGGYCSKFSLEDFPLLGSQSVKSGLNVQFSRPVYQLRAINPLTEPKELSLPSCQYNSHQIDEGYVTPVTDSALADQPNFVDESEDPTQLWSDALQVTHRRVYSWETLGMRVTEPEKPFFSAAPPEALNHMSLVVDWHQNKSNQKNSDFTLPHTVSRKVFMRDALYLLIGIESDTFLYSAEKDCLIVHPGLCLEGYTIHTTEFFCKDFLFCGTHFQRLEKFSNPQRAKVDNGLVVQALKESIWRWTRFYHGFALLLSNQLARKNSCASLFDLLEKVQILKQQVECLAQLSNVLDPQKCTEPLPSGVALLALVYHEASMSNPQLSLLLYSVLRSCCMVYLSCLEQWIFHGSCSDGEFEEFFIHSDRNFSSQRNRLYWTKGFVLNKNFVPDFLKGLENVIFDCGRALNLLFLCDPHHPLCCLLKKKHPTLRCCLFKTDLEIVQNECAEFELEIIQKCGGQFSLAKHFEEEREHETQLHLLILKVQEKKAVARASLRAQQLKQMAERKRQQNDELRAQMEVAEQRRANSKRQQQLDDELYLRECKQAEEALEQKEEAERQRLLAYYHSLNEVAEQQSKQAEWQLKRLKLAEKRHEFILKAEIQDFEEYKGHDATSNNATFGTSIESTSSRVKDVPNIPEDVDNKTCIEVCHDFNQLMISGDKLLDNDNLTKSIQECVEDVDPDWKKNRRKVLEANIEFNHHLVREDTTITNKVTKETGVGKAENCKTGQNKSDVVDPAWKINRKKVLGTDINNYQLNADNEHVSSDDMKEACLENQGLKCQDKRHGDCVESEFKINKRKILGSDMHFGYQLTTDIEKEAISTVEKENESSESHEGPARPHEVDDFEPEWKRNRRRVLQTEFNTLTGESLSYKATLTPLVKDTNASLLSDLEKNRRKILEGEFNILTGDCKSECLTASLPLKAAWEQNESSVQSSLHSPLVTGTCDPPDTDERHVPSPDPKESAYHHTRPQSLQIASKTSICSLNPTPLSCSDFPVFKSPFEGTSCLPNELYLTSPFKSTSNGFGHRVPQKEALPIMVDIFDSLPQKLGLSCEGIEGTNCKDTKTTAPFLEPTNSSPNTAWLESSLQKCLLIPLRVQHRFVSAALLQYFMVDMKLLSHLKSLRSYYFMLDGEFGRHLTVKLFTEMYQVKTPAGLLNVCTLNNLLREALCSSQGVIDQNRNQLSLCVTKVPHHFSHYSPNVLDCLHLLYCVQWPLNVVLTEQAIEKYNLVFLFLVRLRRVAWLLQEDFIALKKTALSCLREENGDLLNSPQYHQVQMIRHAMSQFVQAISNYVSSSVLNASWSDFEESLKQAKTIDHVYASHISYVKQLIKRCLLNKNSERVEAVLAKILSHILQFHSQLRVRQWQLPNEISTTQKSSQLEHPNFKALLASFKHFKLQVSRLLYYLERLIAPPHQQQHLSDLMLLLNVNGFYKTSDYLNYGENSSV